MANEAQLIGGTSEAIAQAMFLKNGFSVATTVIPEAYDLIVFGKDNEMLSKPFTVQVKTVKIRSDRDGSLVVRGSGSDGKPYSKKEVDYIFGVHLPSVTGYLIPNNEQTEYWSKDMEVAEKKWTKYTL